MTSRLRIKRLLVVVAIAFCWAHRTGEWQHEHVKAIKVKKHLRLAKSIFRVGLDYIRETLLSTTYSLKVALETLIKFIYRGIPLAPVAPICSILRYGVIALQMRISDS